MDRIGKDNTTQKRILERYTKTEVKKLISQLKNMGLDNQVDLHYIITRMVFVALIEEANRGK